MNAFDFLADVGVSGTGFEKARMVFEKDARERALEELRIAEAKRREEEAMRQAQFLEGLRRVAAETGIGGAREIPAQPERTVTVPARYRENPIGFMEGNEPVPMDINMPASPAKPDEQRRAKDMEEFARRNVMDPKITGDLSAHRKNMEAEGWHDYLNGIIAGKPVEEIMDGFNRSGTQRINGGIKNPDGSYSFQFDDGTIGTITQKQARELGERTKVFTRDPWHNVPRGSTAVRGSGADQEVIHGLAPNEDPNSQAVIDRKKTAAESLIRVRQEIKSQYGDKGTAMERNVAALSKWFGVSPAEAWEMSRVGMKKPDQDAVLDVAVRLKTTDPMGIYDGADGLTRLYEDARATVAESRRPVPGTPRAGPEQLAGPGTPGYKDPQAKTGKAYTGEKPPSSHPTAKKAPDGFWYVGPDENGAYSRVISKE